MKALGERPRREKNKLEELLLQRKRTEAQINEHFVFSRPLKRLSYHFLTPFPLLLPFFLLLE